MIIGGIALFHKRAFTITLGGLVGIVLYRYTMAGLGGDFAFSLPVHLHHEASTLTNLFLLLLGFALLAKHFEESNAVGRIVRYVPDGRMGCFVLLGIIWILSSFLDNIAAAMIGGTLAIIIFRKKVHIGYIAAIVAASNAGGAWSVVGDTTTTLMWIEGVPASRVAHGIIASCVAYAIFGTFAAWQQNRYCPLRKADINLPQNVDWGKVGIVFLILVGAIITNMELDFPAVGVWAAILLGATFRKTPWYELKIALPGSLFLVMLVTCASMMPVKELPDPSQQTAFILGVVSAVFDNIPLTKLALVQNGYDWGMLAFTVGFGGSMIWFGSSAGVAITTIFPQARSVGSWVRSGWHVALAYVVAFGVFTVYPGWEPWHIPRSGPTAIVAPASEAELTVRLPKEINDR
jgi:Na+/H+ antiporter NhaD/arsenite permease-like protein